MDNFAIPGFMQPTSAKADVRIIVDSGQTVRIDILAIEVGQSAPAFEIHITKDFGGKSINLIETKSNRFVFEHSENGLKTIYLKFKPVEIPLVPGTYVIFIYWENETLIRYLTIEKSSRDQREIYRLPDTDEKAPRPQPTPPAPVTVDADRIQNIPVNVAGLVDGMILIYDQASNSFLVGGANVRFKNGELYLRNQSTGKFHYLILKNYDDATILSPSDDAIDFP